MSVPTATERSELDERFHENRSYDLSFVIPGLHSDWLSAGRSTFRNDKSWVHSQMMGFMESLN
jgi:hypothetical protein